MVGQSGMHQRDRQSGFELRFSLLQLVLILPVLFASVFAAYVSGYVSGKKTGFDLARSSAAAHLPGVSVQETAYADQDEAYYEQEAKSLAMLLDKLDEEPETPAGTPLSVVNAGEGVQGLAEREGEWTPLPSHDVSARARLQKPAVHVEEALLSDDSEASATAEEEKAAELKRVAAEERDAQKREEEKKAKALEEKKKRKEAEARKKEEAKKEEPVLKVVPLDVAAQQDKEIAVPKVDARPQDRIRGGFYAQVATVNSITDARQLLGRLQASGFRSVIETARVRGVSYYRVLVGPERTRSRAVILVDQLKRESYLRTQPFIKYVDSR